MKENKQFGVLKNHMFPQLQNFDISLSLSLSVSHFEICQKSGAYHMMIII